MPEEGVKQTTTSLNDGLTSQSHPGSEPETAAGEDVILEICANSIQSVLSANEAGAHRIELCSNLEQGGITPSNGLVQLALQRSKIPINVLIRPRAGNFVYDSDEIDIMMKDVEICKQLGCHGVVVGVLTDNKFVDLERMRALVAHAHPLPVTFHRAFDDCNNQTQALEDIIASGCTRILTSGGGSTAEAGTERLRELVRMAAGRIAIMPGAGVEPANIAKIIESTGVTEIHASAKTVLSQRRVDVGSLFDVKVWQTDPDIVRSLLQELKVVVRRSES